MQVRPGCLNNILLGDICPLAGRELARPQGPFWLVRGRRLVHTLVWKLTFNTYSLWEYCVIATHEGDMDLFVGGDSPEVYDVAPC